MHVGMPTIVGILIFLSIINYMLSQLSMKFRITSGPGKINMSLYIFAVSSEHRFALCTCHCSGRVVDRKTRKRPDMTDLLLTWT